MEINLRKKIDNAIGFTWVVENSDFLIFLNDDPIFQGMCSDAIHYVICTVNKVVEVVSEESPVIQKLV